MKILSDEQYRVLSIIAVCNDSSYHPTAEQVMLWHDNPTPKEATYRDADGSIVSASSLTYMPALKDSFAAIAKFAAGMRAGVQRQLRDMELVSSTESLVQHMVRLTWIKEVPSSGATAGLRLTEMGRALFRSHEREDSDEDVSVVVLGKDDPLAYPMLVGHLAAAGPGLLVDPYLQLDELHMVVVSTGLTRILVSGKPRHKRVVASMRAYLDSASLPRRVEARASTALHDRVLIADAEEQVLTLGTSLNGVGKVTTVLSPMPEKAREVLRADYAQLWNDAELVGPPTRTMQEDEAEREDGPAAK